MTKETLKDLAIQAEQAKRIFECWQIRNVPASPAERVESDIEYRLAREKYMSTERRYQSALTEYMQQSEG